jgi:membrane protein implicated in regulation of membrane protease activity
MENMLPWAVAFLFLFGLVVLAALFAFLKFLIEVSARIIRTEDKVESLENKVAMVQDDLEKLDGNLAEHLALDPVYEELEGK